MRICIIDDNMTMCREIEEKIIRKYGETCCDIKCFDDADELIEYSRANEYDVILVDVELGDRNGIDVAKQIKQLRPQLITVYISAYPQYVFRSFETEPLNYLLKPIDDSLFDSMLNSVLDKYNSLHRTVVIKSWNDLIKLEAIDILYVEGYNRHLTYHLLDGTLHRISGRMDKAFEDLRHFDFVRCHQGFIVNLKYIKSIDEDELILATGESVPVSVRRKIDTKQAYFIYLNRR